MSFIFHNLNRRYIIRRNASLSQCLDGIVDGSRSITKVRADCILGEANVVRIGSLPRHHHDVITGLCEPISGLSFGAALCYTIRKVLVPKDIGLNVGFSDSRDFPLGHGVCLAGGCRQLLSTAAGPSLALDDLLCSASHRRLPYPLAPYLSRFVGSCPEYSVLHPTSRWYQDSLRQLRSRFPNDGVDYRSLGEIG